MPTHIHRYFNEESNELEPFDIKRLTFTEPEKKSVTSDGNSGKKGKKGKKKKSKKKSQTVEFHRMKAVATDEDYEGPGELFLLLQDFFCYGVFENTSMETGNITGYSAALSMWDNNTGATPLQQIVFESLESIKEQMIDAIIEHKKALGKAHFTKEFLMGDFKLLRWKKDDLAKEKAPTLYGKCITKTQQGDEPPKIVTKFYLKDKVDEDGNMIELPSKMIIGSKLRGDFLIKVDGIFCGSKIVSPQCKLWEAHVNVVQGNLQQMVKPTKAIKATEAELELIRLATGGSDEKKSKDKAASSDEDSDSDESESSDSDDEDSKKKKKSKKKKSDSKKKDEEDNGKKKKKKKKSVDESKKDESEEDDSGNGRPAISTSDQEGSDEDE